MRTKRIAWGQVTIKKVIALVVLSLFAASIVMMAVPPTQAQSYTYTFIGPYYERSGQVGTDTVQLTIEGIYTTAQKINLTGNGVTPATYTYVGFPLSYVTYNVSTALNLTRTIQVLPSDNGRNFFIYIPYPNEPINTYYFSVTDYTGTVEYLQADTVTPGGNRIIERKSLGISGTVSFTMEQYTQYSLTLIADANSLSQGFYAENILSTNIPVLLGSFPTNTYGYSALALASRLNGTALQVNYTDIGLNTTNIDLTITHQAGLTTITDFQQSYAGTALSLTWANAEEATTYQVNVTATMTDLTTNTWLLPVPTLPVSDNPFTPLAKYFTDTVQTFPTSAVLPPGFNLAQAPAAIIIALVLAFASFSNHEAGCLLSWVVAAIMVLLGWFTVSVPAFGFALFTSILIAFAEAKKTEREL